MTHLLFLIDSKVLSLFVSLLEKIKETKKKRIENKSNATTRKEKSNKGSKSTKQAGFVLFFFYV